MNDGNDDGGDDCLYNAIPNRVLFFFLFFAGLKGQKSGDTQANSKNVAGITVSTTQCLYVVR